MPIHIQPKITIFDQASHTANESGSVRGKNQLVVTPGEVIATTGTLMLGHGTYSEASSADSGQDLMMASLAGRVVNINKLIYVDPPMSRYAGKVGDVIVGRITEVSQRRWTVDTNSRLLSQLPLTNVILPGGELRRKSEEDERAMRRFLKEGDLIVAEIRDLHSDGSIVLHMRSQRYSKLGQGCVVKVPSSLVKRQKMHIHSLPFGVTIILGTNGMVWIGATHSANLGFLPDEEAVTSVERDNVCRIRNCVALLAKREMPLFHTSVLVAYEASLAYNLKDFLDRETQNELIQVVNAKLLSVNL